MSQLPHGWTKSTVGDVCDILDARRVPVNAQEREQRRGDVPYYGATGQVGWINGYLFDEELVLLGEDGAPFLDPAKPKAYAIRGKSWVNNHAHVLRARESILSSFLLHQLNALDYHGFVTGTTRLKLPQAPMRSIPLLLAPLAEQRRIVAALEEHLSDLDAAMAGLERARRRLEHYRRAILYAIASSAAAARMGWKVLPLGELASTSSGGTPNRSRPEFFGGGIPWLKSGELNDGVVSAAEESLTQAGLANSSAKLFPSGTLCIALYGATVGRLGVLDFDAATNQAICGIQPCETVDTRWLFYVLLEGRQRLIDQGKGGAQSNISQGIVRAYPVPVPSRDQQRELVEEIEGKFAVADHSAIELDVQLVRAVRLRQAILKRAFEGKLVPQDPNDEPASALLERIRNAPTTTQRARGRRGQTRAAASRRSS